VGPDATAAAGSQPIAGAQGTGSVQAVAATQVTGAGASRIAPGSFLGRLNAEERDAVLAIGRECAFPRGAVILHQGEPQDRILVLLAGRVKVTRLDGDGRESLLSIRDPGDVLGELSFVDGQPRIATITTLEPVHALVTSASRLRRHLETTPRTAVVLLEVVVARFRESTLKRTELGVSDTMGRLAARVLELAERYGTEREGGIDVEVPITRQDLAAWIGASRAGAAEALRQMRELGWIQIDGRRLLVRDLGALRSRAA
jgi:CRP/FNR family cyclic AMP-dependent transcriptional regulator